LNPILSLLNPFRFELNLHLAVVIRKLESIADEIDEYLLEPVLICIDLVEELRVVYVQVAGYVLFL